MNSLYWMSLLIITPVLVLAQNTAQQSSDETSNSSDEGESNSFIGKKAKIIIIVLSVVAGAVVIFSIASSILYLIAKRRQWTIRETIRQSARRMTDAIKSPLTPRFSRSAGENSSRHQTTLYTRRQQQRDKHNRSSRGMTRIAEEESAHIPYAVKDDGDDVLGLIDSRDSERYVRTTKSIWRHSHSESNGSNTTTNKNNISTESYFFDFGSKPADRKTPKLKQKKQEFDLERGIELGATDHMKVTVSLSAKNSDEPPKRSWGSLFAFGRG